MAFRTHNPNLVGPLLSDETWKVSPSKGSPSSDRVGKCEASKNDDLQDIDELIRHFDHITVGKENPILPNDVGLNISKRLADLYDPSKQPETIGGDILPLSATKKEPLVSPRSPERDRSYSFQANESSRYSSELPNDRLPSFRLREPPHLQRTTSGSSSFPMHVLGRRKTARAPSAPTMPPTNDRSTMNYSLAARQHLPSRKTELFRTLIPDASQHNRKSSHTVMDPETKQQAEACAHRIRVLTSKCTAKTVQEAELILRSMVSQFDGNLHKVRPNGVSYNNVIHAYASLGLPSKAEKVLSVMFDDWKHGNANAEPNVRIFTGVLKAWQRAKTRESPMRCEKIIEAMNELSSDSRLANCKPDLHAMTVLMHAWIDAPRKNVAEKICRIFCTMKRKYAAGDNAMRPDCIVYSLVLNAYVREFSTKKAEAILWEMVDDYLDGNESAKPRVRK